MIKTKKEMIVISNNNSPSIESFLERMNECRGNYDVLLVDTHSNNEDYENLCIEECKKYDFIWKKSDSPDYDFSGIKTAMKYFPREKYWFQQDTLIPKSSDCYDKIFKEIKDNTPVSWLGFERKVSPFDNEDSLQFCLDNFNSSDYDTGIFGPNFGITRDDVSRIKEIDNLYVTNKIEQSSMERGWAILFKKYNMTPKYMEGILTPDWTTLHDDGYTLFSKKFLHRV